MADEKPQQTQGAVATPPPPPTQDEKLRAELEKTRAGNKLLKIAAILLASLFVVLAAAAIYIYNRISSTARQLESFQNALPPPSAYAPENRGGQPPASSMVGFSFSTSSGLGLFTGGAPADANAPAITAEDGQRMMNAFSKYSDRPVVKEFIADMKKDPELAKVLEQNKDANPIAMLATIQNSKKMELLAAKYAMRPDFIKLLMEVSADPAIKPMMNRMPGGLPQMPAAVPQQAQVPAGPDAAPQPDQGEPGGPMTLDTSVISGSSSEQPAKPKAKKTPLPIDNQ
jgi:hypothetical protein